MILLGSKYTANMNREPRVQPSLAGVSALFSSFTCRIFEPHTRTENGIMSIFLEVKE
jgi:hypothetical protein